MPYLLIKKVLILMEISGFAKNVVRFYITLTIMLLLMILLLDLKMFIGFVIGVELV